MEIKMMKIIRKIIDFFTEDTEGLKREREFLRGEK
jgi:hypothetical protein